MGLLVEGKWVDQWYDTQKTGGQFKRQESQFRNWLTPDGKAGQSGRAGFKAEKDRYHLYVSLACPWAHRTLIYRKLFQLDNYIDVSIVHPVMLEHGWTFEKDDAATGDNLYHFDYMHQIYTKADKQYTGRVTVPVLWDKEQKTIVSNESAEIIRMLGTAFQALHPIKKSYYPENLISEIDAINSFIYGRINNGVYKAGFATTSQAYEEHVIKLFDALDELEERLSNHRYLLGNNITEADWRLFTTLIRFDAVYVGHFKCNIRRIDDYINLSGYMRDLYQQPNIAETVNMDHIKTHYYASHKTINPTLIVPKGPVVDFLSPHNRG